MDGQGQGVLRGKGRREGREAETRGRIWGTGAVEQGVTEADRGGGGRTERVGKLIKRGRGREGRGSQGVEGLRSPPQDPYQTPHLGRLCLGIEGMEGVRGDGGSG